MQNLLKSLCTLAGVSGSEDEVRDYIIKHAQPYVSDIYTDPIGNVIAYKKASKPGAKNVKRLMLCAHMDEVGVIITGITEDGFLHFACVGGIDNRVLPGKTVLLGKNRVFGVIGSPAVHLTTGAARDKITAAEDLYIDIGADNRLAAEQFIKLGDAGIFGGDTYEFGNGFIKARAIDDRLGCAIMLKIMQSDMPCDCHFAFTVQEEVGVRGAQTAAYRTKPDIALVIETAASADLPSVSEGKKVCKIGGGPVIPFMDGGTVYDRGLYDAAGKLAERNGITWQPKNRIAGGTDARSIQLSRGGVRTLAISAPVRNLHSPACVAAVSDCEAVYKLVVLCVNEFCEGRL